MIKSTNYYPTKAFSEADLTRNRALVHTQAWDGYNLTWLNYANEVRKCLTDFKYEKRDQSTRFKVVETVETFFRIIVQKKINTRKEFRDSREIQNLKTSVESQRIWEVFTEVDSLVNTHTEVESFGSKVSDFVKNIYHAT